MSELKLNPEVLKTPIQDNKILLLEPTKGQYFELNETSVLIYQAIESGMTSELIIEKLISRYGCEINQVKQDFEELIKQFKQNNILL